MIITIKIKTTIPYANSYKTWHYLTFSVANWSAETLLEAMENRLLPVLCWAASAAAVIWLDDDDDDDVTAAEV